jgi:hypothetical protein
MELLELKLSNHEQQENMESMRNEKHQLQRELELCMYKKYVIKPALVPWPLMIYCASPDGTGKCA